MNLYMKHVAVVLAGLQVLDCHRDSQAVHKTSTRLSLLELDWTAVCMCTH